MQGFAGADVRAEARADRLNVRIQTLETRVRLMEQSVAGVSAQLQSLETRTQQVEQAVARNSTKLDEILSRLPRP
jgi:septal ring factor EnvC (AmiA/AmiB activator)